MSPPKEAFVYVRISFVTDPFILVGLEFEMPEQVFCGFGEEGIAGWS